MIEAESLWDLVERRATQTPDARFAIDEDDRELTFAQYRDAALRCAAGLHARGVGPDTPVSWMLPTWLESLVPVAALARLGARQNPILPVYREREVSFIARQTGADLLIVPSVFRGFDYAAMARTLTEDGGGVETLVVDRALPEGDPEALPAAPPPTSPEDAPVRWVFYSSGTTADPKGALHTDHTLMVAGGILCDVLALREDDRVALVFPLTHIGGIGWLVAGLRSGASHIVVAAFDPEKSIDVLARHGVTQATAGTVFHQAYLAAQRARGSDKLFPRIRAFPGGGAPKPPQLHRDLVAEMGGAGIVSGYGMTECPIVTMNTVATNDDKLAHTEGQPQPAAMRVRIVDGELRVRGPQLCKGYLDESLNADAFDDEGFFRTGDLGHLDADGYAVITGRLKDIIIRKGENISAKEVEDLLYTHPKVRDVAVIGLPDPALGERCCAVVSCPPDGEPLAFDEMVEFLDSSRLMRQKIPEQLEIVPEVPRNPTGKVPKHELRARFAES